MLMKSAFVKYFANSRSVAAFLANEESLATAAEAYFGKAAGTKELGESMGNLYIAHGPYERAVNSFGDSKTNSAALAQILAKDYNKAKNTLANVERPDAYTDYLMAVLGARTNNSSMVTSSLKSAVAKIVSIRSKDSSIPYR